MSSSSRPRQELGYAPILQGQRTVIDDRRNLLELLAKHAYDYSPGRYTLSSGKPSDEYLDCKNALSWPAALPSLGRLVVSYLAPDVVAVGGLTMGADPIAVSASLMSAGAERELRWFLVRKDAKLHGMKKTVEGNVKAGEHVAIVDDVVTTGGSTIDAIKKCREFGLLVEQVIVLVDREQDGGLQNIISEAGPDVPVKAMFTKSEVRREWEQRQTLRRIA